MTDTTSDGSRPIGIVVVNYASSALIEANLAAVDPVDAQVVIVDNASTPAERRAVRRLADGHSWALVEMTGNPGFGAGVNAGVAKAQELGCCCFLLLNPDAAVTAETVAALRRACLDDPMALVAPRLVDLAGRAASAGSTLNLVDGRIRGLQATLADPDPRARPVSWLTAACLAFSADLWRRTGGFDEGYFMYWEDVDFGYRAAGVGGRVALRQDLTAVHDQGGTQGPRRGRAKSSLYYYYNCRNRLLFGLRHLGPRDLFRWLVLTPQVSWEILLRGGRRQLLTQPRLAWSAAAGGLTGIWLAARHLARPTGPATSVRGRALSGQQDQRQRELQDGDRAVERAEEQVPQGLDGHEQQ